MDKSVKAHLFRQIPQVEQILNRPLLMEMLARTNRTLVVFEVNRVLDGIRDAIMKGLADESEVASAIAQIDHEVQARVSRRLRLALVPAVNATGVIIHTNLGRAILSMSAQQALLEAAGNYTNLEYDLKKAERSSRDRNISVLLSEFLGCEAATVVNNNAAAVFIILNTLGLRKEVIVSRGELVEIGGSFRIPEIMERSGALLKEVGTTNKTRIRDYEAGISDHTGLILRVHPSNYRIIGFVERPSLGELVELGGRYSLPVVEDSGSGCLVNLEPYGITEEPIVQESLGLGVDLVCFSGDKLLGGPQCGIIVGKESWIRQIRRNPLMRMVRVDKLTYAALEATLIEYVKEKALEEIPVLKMITARAEDLNQRASAFLGKLQSVISNNVRVSIAPAYSMVGGGSCPDVRLASPVISVQATHLTPNQIERKLREFSPPVIARLENDQLLIDLRTVFPAQEEILLSACAQL